jgi:hypothetical protein
MQEFELPIQINKGLRPDERIGRGFGREYSHELNRLVPQPFGLRAANVLDDLIDPLDVSWPNPRAFRMQDRVLLFGSDFVSTLNDTGNPPWLYSKLATYALDNPDQTALIYGQGIWNGTEDELFGVYTNGSVVVILGQDGFLSGYDDKVLVADIPVNTVTRHEGRVIYGGLSPNVVWTDEWRVLFDEVLNDSPAQVNYEERNAIRDNFIFWSSINGTDALWPLKPPEVGEWRDIFRRNQAGFTPLPTPGQVLRVLPLGDGAVAYSTTGVYYMRPMIEPVSTYGLQRIGRKGMMAIGAVAGTENEHLFMDEEGDLWKLATNLTLSYIGGKEFTAAFEGNLPIFSYDSLDDEYWLSDGSTTLVVSNEGIGASNQQPLSILVDQGERLSPLASANRDDEYRWFSEVLDFRYRDLKTVTMVEVGMQNPSFLDDPVQVAVDYSYDQRGDFARSSWVTVSPEGFARIQITALEFRVGVRWQGGVETDPELDYINVKWQRGGRRTARGLSSATSPGQ